MNVNKLKAKCVEKGINIETLAKNIGVGVGTFYRKLKEGSFTVEEARKIAECLELSNNEIIEIFFSENVA